MALACGNHKTVKAHGPIELDLDSTVGNALDKYLIYLRAKTKHGFLLSTKRYGNKLTRKDMMAMIRNTTKERLGKNIGIQKTISKALTSRRSSEGNLPMGRECNGSTSVAPSNLNAG